MVASQRMPGTESGQRSRAVCFQMRHRIGAVDADTIGQRPFLDDYEATVAKVHFTSELFTMSKLCCHLRQVGCWSEEQCTDAVRPLVGRLEQGLLCDCFSSADLEVELLAFVSQAESLGAGNRTHLLRVAGELQDKAAS